MAANIVLTFKKRKLAFRILQCTNKWYIYLKKEPLFGTLQLLGYHGIFKKADDLSKNNLRRSIHKL
jgi:hypothetical protein